MRDLLSGEIVAWHDYWSPQARYRQASGALGSSCFEVSDLDFGLRGRRKPAA